MSNRKTPTVPADVHKRALDMVDEYMKGNPEFEGLTERQMRRKRSKLIGKAVKILSDSDALKKRESYERSLTEIPESVLPKHLRD